MSKSEDERTPEGGGSGDARRAPRRLARPSSEPRPIDLGPVLEEPVRINQDGVSKPITPYEATLRQQVAKAIRKHSLGAIRFLLGEARKHKLIEASPPPLSGGVFIIPKNLPPEVEREAWDELHDFDSDAPMLRMMAVLIRYGGMDLLVRCFSDRRKD